MLRRKSAFINGFKRLFCVNKQTVKMSSVYVRCVTDEDRMQISLDYKLSNGKLRTFNMNRCKSEDLGVSLERLWKNIQKAEQKRKKAKLSATEESGTSLMNVSLLNQNTSVISSETINELAWVEGSVLKIYDINYPIIVNTPTINSVRLPDSMLSGFAIYPRIDAEFTDFSNSEFKWYRLKVNDDATAGAATNIPSSCVDLTEVSSSMIYRPSNDDIGHYLKLVCKAVSASGSIGRNFEIISKCVVNAGPGVCTFDRRHLFTQNNTENSCYRIVSYNILADMYADSEYTRTVLFPYCAHYALELDYRKHLLLKEIIGYNADIVCLQEVDKKVFMSDLGSAMELEGFVGNLKLKGGQAMEGCAMFHRSSKLRLVADHSIVLTEHLQSSPALSSVWSKIEENEKIKNMLLERSTIAQVIVMESLEDPKKKICCVNTHLYFHPIAHQIRLIQTITTMKHIEEVVEQYRTEDEQVAIVYCGDFNSGPEWGANKFITEKSCSAEFRDWQRDPEKSFCGVDVTHNFNMASACGYQAYSNFTAGFHGLLDYIFIDKDYLEVSEVIPNIDNEEVTQHTALPSVVHPSDHIAQICVVKWK